MEILEKLDLNDVEIELSTEDLVAQYVVNLMYVLLPIVNNEEFQNDVKNGYAAHDFCSLMLHHITQFAIYPQLHASFCSEDVFKRETRNIKKNIPLLHISVTFYAHCMRKIFQLTLHNELRVYMVAIYSLFQYQENKELTVNERVSEQWHVYLNHMWTTAEFQAIYVKTLIQLRGMSNLSPYMKQLLHKKLMEKLATEDGFATLLKVMFYEKQQGSNEQIIEDIAEIVTNREYPCSFQSGIIKHIFLCFKKCVSNSSTDGNRQACILSLRRLYDLNAECKMQFELNLKQCLQGFIQTENCFIMKLIPFYNLIKTLVELFCNPIVACLPIVLLVNYLPMLLQLHFNVPKMFGKAKLGMLITCCLDNCTDLNTCIQNLYTQKYPEQWKQLHARIRVKVKGRSFHKIWVENFSTIEEPHDFSISLSLPDILMEQQHNHLTYRIFILLLKQFSELLQENESNASYAGNNEMLQTKEELKYFIHSHYSVKLEIQYTLNQIVTHAPLRAQISEHAPEYLQFLRDFISMRLSLPQTNAIGKQEMDQMLLMLLLVCQELLQQTHVLPEQMESFAHALKHLHLDTTNKLLQNCLDVLLPLVHGELDLKPTEADLQSAFNTACQLIETNESFSQVQGLQMLLDLLRRNDEMIYLNKDVVVALALSTLRAPESYTFLNCVRLFVALISMRETKLLKVLCNEYMNDKGELNYRIVVGEALVKVSKEIGPLRYKYWIILFSCFLHGAKSPLDEMRISAFTNLSVLCKILCYQVDDFFFQLLNIIENELSFGKSLAAKRLAVLVLSELLEGMGTFYYREMLLPFYKCLKVIEADSNADAQMRLYASKGLKALNDDYKFFKEHMQDICREIKILDIK